MVVKMTNYRIVDGDVIKLARDGKFDVIVHGCNCFCRMKRGIAPQMAEAFGADRFPLENTKYTGDIRKLGQIDIVKYCYDLDGKAWNAEHEEALHLTGTYDFTLHVVNAYTQYTWDTNKKPFDYDAFKLCLRKLNHIFKGKHIGMPKIGSHLAGGVWGEIEKIIKHELKDCRVTVVNYVP